MKNFHHNPDFWFAVAAILGFTFLSPKWLVAPLAWIAPALLLLSTRHQKPLSTFFVACVVLFISGIIGNYNVIPFPFVFFIIITIKGSVIAAVPYLLNQIIYLREKGWMSTLVFPSLAVFVEYVNSFSGGGTWTSLANTQVDNLVLAQLVSVTGVWGISFLIYWFAALVLWTSDQQWKWTLIRVPIISYAALLSVVMLYGAIRLNPFLRSGEATVRVAGITGWNLTPLATIYHDAFQKKITLDANTISNNSPELAELNKALAIFIESPFEEKFNQSHRALAEFHDAMFAQAEREAQAGARIIVFSEALMFTLKPIEDTLISKAISFSKKHKVRMLLTMGSFIPGKVKMGKKYLENKAILINETGENETVFFKNKPVPLVEGSVPGNGEIPVIETVYGDLAVSICYDADFPVLMRKAGQQNAGLMLLPSGDWKEISPYHADMARLRAIENGFSLMRPASGATSVACDNRGRIIATRNFFDEGPKNLVAYMPAHSTFTIYSRVGDVLPWMGLAYTVFVLFTVFVMNSGRKHSNKEITGLGEESRSEHPAPMRQD